MGRRDGLPDDKVKAPKEPPAPLPDTRRSPPPSDIKTKDDIRGKAPK